MIPASSCLTFYHNFRISKFPYGLDLVTWQCPKHSTAPLTDCHKPCPLLLVRFSLIFCCLSRFGVWLWLSLWTLTHSETAIHMPMSTQSLNSGRIASYNNEDCMTDKDMLRCWKDEMAMLLIFVRRSKARHSSCSCCLAAQFVFWWCLHRLPHWVLHNCSTWLWERYGFNSSGSSQSTFMHCSMQLQVLRCISFLTWLLHYQNSVFCGLPYGYRACGSQP